MINQVEKIQSALVICINYHSEKETQAFVRELLRQKSTSRVRVIVVENSERTSSNSVLTSLAEYDQRVSILNPGSNLGYFGGAAWALRQHLANTSLTDWVIVSNTDISFLDCDFFNRLFELYSSRASAVIAPAIYSTLSAVDQNPFMLCRPNAIQMHFYKLVFRYYPICISYQMLALVKQKLRTLICKIIRKNISQQRPQVIYSPHGSFIIFHRSYFEAGGSLDHGVFLFGEEVFIAETIRRLGLTATYDPRLAVLHHEHATTGIFLNRKMARYVREASAYCADEFFQ